MWIPIFIIGAIALGIKLLKDSEEKSKKLDQNPARKVLQDTGLAPSKPAATGNPAIDALNQARAAVAITKDGRTSTSINKKDDEDFDKA
jgi:hypothetical protein